MADLKNTINFARIPNILELPDLVDMQKKSYKNFLQLDIKTEERDMQGLEAAFQDVFPVFNSDDEQKITDLKFNIPYSKNITLEIPNDLEYTNPYWLNQKGTNGMYRIDKQEIIGVPDVLRNVKVGFWIEINSVEIPFEQKVVYKFNDDIKGEVYQPLDIVPAVTSSLTEKVYIFNI